MQKWLGAFGALLIAFGFAWAQVVPQPGPPTPIACAHNTAPVTLTDGQAGWVQCTSAGKLDVSATTSVSGFAPAGTFATLTATGSSASVALPSGAVVLFQNTGTTAVSCTLGVGSATALVSENIVQPGSWLALTVGANTFGACIDQTGSASNTVVLSGGSGIPTGSGGGASASGSLSATATAAAPAYSEGASVALSTDLTGNTRVIAQGLGQNQPTAGQTAALILCAVTTSPTSYTTGQSSACSLDVLGNIRVAMTNQYPSNAVPYTASATGTTGATTATLAAAGAATSYICGFSIRANATAAATNNATVTGTISGTLNFTQWTAPLASGLGITEMIFTPCLPGSAANQAIAVVSGAPGSGGVVSVTAWGYKL